MVVVCQLRLSMNVILYKDSHAESMEQYHVTGQLIRLSHDKLTRCVLVLVKKMPFLNMREFCWEKGAWEITTFDCPE